MNKTELSNAFIATVVVLNFVAGVAVLTTPTPVLAAMNFGVVVWALAVAYKR